MLAVSRKDFIGAINHKSPSERGPGTFGALAFGLDCGARLLRVHDVAGTRDFLAVWESLRGEALTVADYARLEVANERLNTDEVLAELRLPSSALLVVMRVFARRTATSAPLRNELRAARAEARARH